MTETIDIMVEGGKATAGPQMGQILGPLGINISDVLLKINEKTSSFNGMKVPVKLTIEDDKSFDLEVGTPPVSELIKKELNLKKGSGEPNKNKIGNIAIEQTIKIAKMKQDSMFINSLKAAVKCIIGSCNSLGLLIEGKTAVEINEDIDNGVFDKEIEQELTTLSPEKQKKLKTQLAEINAELLKELEKQKELEEAEEKAIEEAAERPEEEVVEGEGAEEGAEPKEGEAKEGETAEEGKTEESADKKEESKEEKK